MDNREAAASGDHRKQLETLRDTLAGQLDLTTAQVHAQLAAQYRTTCAELAVLTGEKIGGSIDELKQLRDVKGWGAKAHASSNA